MMATTPSRTGTPRAVIACLAAALTLSACTPSGDDPTTAPVSPTSSNPATAVEATTADPTDETTTPTVADPGESQVRLYLLDSGAIEGGGECDSVVAVDRPIEAPFPALERVLRELLSGVTSSEEADGHGSWFTDATTDDLLGTAKVGSTLYVNLADFSADIPNASTSCGSAGLLAQLDTTLMEFTGAESVCYAFDGSQDAFWEWLQMGPRDGCDAAVFPPAATDQPVAGAVTLYYGDPATGPEGECDAVAPVERNVDMADPDASAALHALVWGPTVEELEAHYTSWFTFATRDVVLGSALVGDTFYANFQGLPEIIPNASASCGSAALLASLDATVMGASGATATCYALDGSLDAFYGWLQMVTPEQCDQASVPAEAG